MSEETKQKERPATAAATPGPARLYALLAGAFLALLGVLGFFYDAEFGTGDALASDDLQGLLNINGWRNVIYIATGVIALTFAARSPRRTALGLGLFYLVFAIWGYSETDRDIGNLFDAIPLGDTDNNLHLLLGLLGLGAALVDGPLPKLPERFRPKKPKKLKAPKLNLSRKPAKGKAKADDEVAQGARPDQTGSTGSTDHRGRSGLQARADLAAEAPQALAAPATPDLDQDEAGTGDPAGCGGRDRADPVARVAQRLTLGVRELVGEPGELARRRFGDVAKRGLDAGSEPLGRLDRSQRIGEHSLEIERVGTRLSHRRPPPRCAPGAA